MSWQQATNKSSFTVNKTKMVLQNMPMFPRQLQLETEWCTEGRSGALEA